MQRCTGVRKRPQTRPEKARVSSGIIVSGPVPINGLRKGKVIATVGKVRPVKKATKKGRENITKF